MIVFFMSHGKILIFFLMGSCCYILICITTQWRRKTSEDFFIKIFYLSLYCKGSKGLFKGFTVRGSWRLNINCNILTPLLWPSLCVFLVLLMLGSTPSGFPRAPSVGCGFPYHIWSLAVWNSTGDCSGSSNSTQF